MAIALITVHCKLFQMVSFIIILKSESFISLLQTFSAQQGKNMQGAQSPQPELGKSFVGNGLVIVSVNWVSVFIESIFSMWSKLGYRNSLKCWKTVKSFRNRNCWKLLTSTDLSNFLSFQRFSSLMACAVTMTYMSLCLFLEAAFSHAKHDCFLGNQFQIVVNDAVNHSDQVLELLPQWFSITICRGFSKITLEISSRQIQWNVHHFLDWPLVVLNEILPAVTMSFCQPIRTYLTVLIRLSCFTNTTFTPKVKLS